MPRSLIIFALIFFGLSVAATPARALFDDAVSPKVSDPTLRPPTMQTLQDIPGSETFKDSKPITDSKGEVLLKIREDAIREAALSYGARGGLAWRAFEIRHELQQREGYLDKVYNFRALLIQAPSGLLIEPPIVAESIDAMNIDGKGLEAAVADRILNINVNAKIVSAPRNWRQYLEREWGAVTEPPDLLRPVSAAERENWKRLVAEGWAQGMAQADEIFQQDLNRLTADFAGMVRYRKLLNQGMVSLPFALQTDRGITGGGEEMRIGDRAVQITGLPEFIPSSDQWQPADR